MTRKRGPKVSPPVGDLKPHTVLLDDLAVRMLEPLGENKSDAIRKAIRTAYRVYQKTPDSVGELRAAVEAILEDGHMSTEHLARLRAAWEAA